MSMSEGSHREVFAKRVRLFAKAGIISAVVVLLLAGLRGVLSLGTTGGFGLYERALEGSRFIELRMALAFLDAFIRYGLETAVAICGVAVILLLLLRLAAAGQKPSWAPQLDDTFATRAKVLAIALQVLAWLFLLYYGLSGPLLYYQLFSGTRAAGMAIPGFDRAFQMAAITIQYLTGAVGRFFILMSGALIIRALLFLSRSGADLEESAREGAPCQ